MEKLSPKALLPLWYLHFVILAHIQTLRSVRDIWKFWEGVDKIKQSVLRTSLTIVQRLQWSENEESHSHFVSCCPSRGDAHGEGRGCCGEVSIYSTGLHGGGYHAVFEGVFQWSEVIVKWFCEQGVFGKVFDPVYIWNREFCSKKIWNILKYRFPKIWIYFY